MNISPGAESALIDLASRGLWLLVQDNGKLQPIATRNEPTAITDDLKAVLASHRAELVEVIPLLENERIELTDAAVCVLFARLTPDEQQRAFDMRKHGNRRQENERFYRDFDNLNRTERVIYLWAYVYGPPANVIQMRKVSA